MRKMMFAFLMSLLPGLAGAAEVYIPSRERPFTGATQSMKRRAEYSRLRLLAAVERLDRASCSPSRESLVRNAVGKDLRRAKLIADNMAKAERLASR